MLAFGISISSQTLNKTKTSKLIITKAPARVSNKFANDYPGVKPVWNLNDANYEAIYTDPETNLKRYILFDKEGNVIRKESELNYTDYPAKINQYYSVRFPDEKFRILKCEAPNGESYYFAKHKEQIIKFDTTGNYILKK